MSNANLRGSKIAALVGAIDPDAYAAGAHTSVWIDAATFHSFMVFVMAGTLGASATLDAKIEQAKDASGTDAKDVTGKAITQLAKADSDDDKQAIINLRPEELDVNNDFTHFRVSMTVGAATSDAGAIVLGLVPRYDTASANDAASVDEVV